MSTIVKNIHIFKNNKWTPIKRVYDGNTWKKMKGIFFEGEWYEIGVTCIVMPDGCAVNIGAHPRWRISTTGGYGTNNFGLNFVPGGICARTYPDIPFYSYAYFTMECNLLIDHPFWSTENVQMLTGAFNSAFTAWYGTGTTKATKNSGASIRACKDYTGNVADGTLFTNAYIDGDGNFYDAVKVGTLLWINENLKTTKFQDGTPITLAASPSDFENNINTPLYSFQQYNSVGDLYKDAYGGLYNWFCVQGGLLVNTDGWRICTLADIRDKLENYIINTNWCNDIVVTRQTVAQYLKSCRQVDHPLATCVVMPEGCAIATTEHPRWNESSLYYGTNNFKFNALPSGIRSGSGNFYNIGNNGHWWSATEYHVNNPWSRTMYYNLSNVYRDYNYKELGFSIRCVKDYTGIEPSGTIMYNNYTDGDGNKYDAVVIGEQLWTIENLKTTKYQNGTNIANVTDNTDWENITTGAYCWYDNDYTTYGQHYGALYNWHAIDGLVNNNGYRVPSDLDWTQLTDYLIGINWCNDVVITIDNVGQFLKSCRQVNHPVGSNLFITNNTGEVGVLKINDVVIYNSDLYEYNVRIEFNVGDVITMSKVGSEFLSNEFGVLQKSIMEEPAINYTLTLTDINHKIYAQFAII